MRHRPTCGRNKIIKHAKKYSISEDVSNTILNVLSISKSLSLYLDLNDFQKLRKTKLFSQMKHYLNLKSSEMIGFIYYLNDRIDDENVFDFLSYLCKTNKYVNKERVFFD